MPCGHRFHLPSGLSILPIRLLPVLKARLTARTALGAALGLSIGLILSAVAEWRSNFSKGAGVCS